MFANMKIYLRISVYDTKTGKLIRKGRKTISKSFVKQFMQILESCFAHPYNVDADSVSILNTSNAAKNVAFVVVGTTPPRWLALEAPGTNTYYGILVGTGTTAVAITDYTIETLIAHGTGSGQLSYGQTTVGTATVVGTEMQMVVSRTLINGSGGSITIKNAGLAMETCDITGSPFYFLIIHDTANTAVGDGQTAVVTYTFTTSV